MFRRSIALIVTLAMSLVACGESENPVTVGGNNTNNTASADAGNDQTTGGTSANADTNDNSGVECANDDLTTCPARTNAEAIACVAFRCAYQCEEGFADDNSDLSSAGGDGCESDCVPTNDGNEVCDGLDNNCDGAVDEGFNVGDACTDGVGECESSGVITCRPDGTADCGASAEAPENEICDGLDNDCDGDVDEENPGSGGSCMTGDLGQCAGGTESCENGELVCVANLAAVAEACGDDLTGDGVDNDCDGDVDENCAMCAEGSQIDCYTGPKTTQNVGRCADGTQTCVNGAFDSCTGETLPGTESCNDIDDDCDGDVDEDFANKGSRCLTGLGVCQTGGVFECTSTGLTTSCVPNQPSVAPSAEVCDGLDNDCDGSTDEDFVLGGRCSAGVGACRQAGQIVCSADGTGTTCDAVPGSASLEVCGNLIDDDCDGEVDEDCDCTTTGCSGGDQCCYDTTLQRTVCVSNPGPMQLCVQ